MQEFGWNLPSTISQEARQILVDTSRALRQLYPTLPEEEVRLASARAGTSSRRTGRQELVNASSNGARVDLAALRGVGEGKVHVAFDPATSTATTNLTMRSKVDVVRKAATAKLALKTSSETSWKPLPGVLRHVSNPRSRPATASSSSPRARS